MDPLNPKDLVGATKPDLSLVTRAMMEAIAAALKNGVAKYGRVNWRAQPIQALTYTAAATRHIKAWEDGEDLASDSGVHHLDHAIASLCIMRDAAAFGTLADNRPSRAPTPPDETKLASPEKRYGVFFGVNGERSQWVPDAFPSVQAAREAIEAEPRAHKLGVDLYTIKQVTP